MATSPSRKAWPAAHAERLLVLVMQRGRQDFADMAEIAREVVTAAPGIVVHIAAPGSTAEDVEGWKWELPALTVSFGELGGFMPRRGPILQNKPVPKLEQHLRFAEIGIATPLTARFAFGRRYAITEFGAFAVLKPLPLRLSSDWRHLILCRTSALESISAESLPPEHFLRRAPVLVQQFIDTGRRPEYFRVLTLLGEPILWMRVKSAADQPDLARQGSDDWSDAIVDPRSTYGTAAADAGDLLEFDIPAEVMDFARAAFRAFPRIPLQACDIVREASTGRLYLLEINAGGDTWDFSSERVAAGREKLGGRARLVSLFDPWPKAARALVRCVRELAS